MQIAKWKENRLKEAWIQRALKINLLEMNTESELKPELLSNLFQGTDTEWKGLLSQYYVPYLR